MQSDREWEEEELEGLERLGVDSAEREVRVISNRPSPAIEAMLGEFSKQLNQQMQQINQQINQQSQQLSQELEQITQQQMEVVGRLDRIEGSRGCSPSVRETNSNRGTPVRSVDVLCTSAASPLRPSSRYVTMASISREQLEEMDTRDSAFRLRRSARLLNKPRPDYRKLGQVGTSEIEERATEYVILGGADENDHLHSHTNVSMVGVTPLSGVAPRESYQRTYNGDEDGMFSISEDIQVLQNKGGKYVYSRSGETSDTRETVTRESRVVIRDSGIDADGLNNERNAAPQSTANLGHLGVVPNFGGGFVSRPVRARRLPIVEEEDDWNSVGNLESSVSPLRAEDRGYSNNDGPGPEIRPLRLRSDITANTWHGNLLENLPTVRPSAAIEGNRLLDANRQVNDSMLCTWAETEEYYDLPSRRSHPPTAGSYPAVRSSKPAAAPDDDSFPVWPPSRRIGTQPYERGGRITGRAVHGASSNDNLETQQPHLADMRLPAMPRGSKHVQNARSEYVPAVVSERRAPGASCAGKPSYVDAAGGHSEKPRNPIKLGLYTGRTPLQLFLRRFEICTQQNQWSSSDQRNHLLCALTDQASQLVWDNSSDGRETVEDVIDRLKARFGTESQQPLFQLQLNSRKQLAGEDLGTLMSDIQRLVMLTYPGKPTPHSELTATRAFIDALAERDIALKVAEREPKSLDEAYRIALRLQGYKQAESDGGRETGRHRGRVQAVRESRSAEQTSQRDLEREVDQLRRRVERCELPSGSTDTDNNHSSFSAPPWFPPWNNAEGPNYSCYANPGFRPPMERPPCWVPTEPCRSDFATVPPRGQGARGRRGGRGGSGRGMHTGAYGPGPESQEAAWNPGGPIRSQYVQSSDGAYLRGELNGRTVFPLLDSGSQSCLCPSRMVRTVDVQPSVQTLIAANGSEIKVIGEATLRLQLGEEVFMIPALVTPQLDDLILGLSWMEAVGLKWKFGDRWVELRGRRLLIHGRSGVGRCRRIVTARDTKIPPYSESNVEAYAVLPNLEKTRALFATQPTLLDTGLIVAGTLLPERTVDLTVRVMNPTSRVIWLKQGVRCDLEEVMVLEKTGSHDSSVKCSAIQTDEPHQAETTLRSLWTDVDADVPEEVRTKLRDLLLEHQRAFSLNETDLGFTDMVQHRIDTGTETPVRQALRRQPLVLLPLIDEQVEVMLQQGLIEKSCSEWASNIVIVTKKDGTPRFCVDYRAVNNKTRKDNYPLPLISECLDSLGGASWFSTFDLKAGYHQVAVHPKDRHKTAFVTRKGSFQFRVLPFGLANSPSCFSRLMGLVMAGLNFAICLVYLDDIIVFASDLGTHLERLTQVLERLSSANLKLKPSKCHLLQRRVLFLGHVVSGEGISTDPSKIEAVKTWPTPTRLKDVRAFLGLCSYYRKFVPDFAQIGRPLHALTKKDTRFAWSEECQSAFELLKTRLTEAPVLALPNDTGTYVIDTDASGESIGAVLSQIQDGQERVICYGSRVCHQAEQNYDVTKRELLAIVYFFKVYRAYLLGRKFLLRTDHSALQWLRRTPLPIGQQARWLTTIEEFDFDVKHRAGTAHVNADALSRRPHKVNVTKLNAHSTGSERQLTEVWSRTLLAEEQSKDPDLGWIMEKKRESENVPSAGETKRRSAVVKLLAAQWPQLIISDGVLMRKWLNEEDNGVRWNQIVLPPSRRADLIRLVHGGMSGGHLGLRRTTAQVQRRAYWPGWREDVRLQLTRCSPCARYFRGKPRRQGLLQNMVVGEIGEVLALDLTGPHPVSSKGHRYILTMIDHFSRFAEAFPVRNQEAGTVAKVLVEQWISRYGCPLQILTDQGPCFEAALFKDLCRMLGVSKLRTSPYKASTNGLLERFHRTLNSMIAKFVSATHKDWDVHLPFLMAAYRSSSHSSTGYTPNKLFLHRELSMPVDLVVGECGDRGEPFATYHDYVFDMGTQIRTTFEMARQCMNRQAEIRAHRYDLGVKPREFTVDQFAWYYYPRRKKGLKEKWLSFYTGPFKIEARVGPVLYRIRKSPRSQAKLVYVDKLKPYFGPVPSAWGGDESHETEEVVGPLVEEVVEEGPEDTEGRPRRQIRRPKRYELDH